MTHHARDESSSRHSFSRSQTKGDLRKHKEEVLDAIGVLDAEDTMGADMEIGKVYRAGSATTRGRSIWKLGNLEIQGRRLTSSSIP